MSTTIYKKKRKKRKRRKELERSHQVRCYVHLNYHLLKRVLCDVEGASAISLSLSGLEATTQMWSKLAGAS